jgi:hypothetical protein
MRFSNLQTLFVLAWAEFNAPSLIGRPTGQGFQSKACHIC